MISKIFNHHPHPYGDLDTRKKRKKERKKNTHEEDRGMVCALANISKKKKKKKKIENVENWGCQMRPFRVGQCGSGKALLRPLACVYTDRKESIKGIKFSGKNLRK
jgi:hypothetical protein